ncbi:MAG TPA: ABC transporter permease [Capillimicrobium sp.]|nr:ABC transporter permease [Capillimicrobium sp.]
MKRSTTPMSVRVALGFLVVVAILVVLGGLLAPHDPRAQDLNLVGAPPGDGHLLGTDNLGRDVLSRIIAGARPAVVGAALVAVGAVLVGTLLGTLAGFKRGRVDAVISRIVDVGIAVPAVLVAMVVAGVTGGGYAIAVAILIVLFAPYDVRFIRAATLEQRGRGYIEAARTLGRSDRAIIVRHLLPNLRPLVLTYALLDFAYALVALTSLSFLGVGSPPGSSDWGRMLGENLSLLTLNAAATLGPALMLILTATSINLVGDWIQDRFTDDGMARA